MEKEKVGPIGEYMEETGLSAYAIAKMTGRRQPTVWRHATGQARIDADSMELYNKNCRISMSKMREWNRYLKEQRETGHDSEDHRAQGGDSGEDSG